MNDTSPEIEKLLREMMLARSGAERCVMAAQMADTARKIIISTLPKDLPPLELKRRLFERIYGLSLDDFIADAVSESGSPSSSSEAES